MFDQTIYTLGNIAYTKYNKTTEIPKLRVGACQDLISCFSSDIFVFQAHAVCQNKITLMVAVAPLVETMEQAMEYLEEILDQEITLILDDEGLPLPLFQTSPTEYYYIQCPRAKYVHAPIPSGARVYGTHPIDLVWRGMCSTSPLFQHCQSSKHLLESTYDTIDGVVPENIFGTFAHDCGFGEWASLFHALFVRDNSYAGLYEHKQSRCFLVNSPTGFMYVYENLGRWIGAKLHKSKTLTDIDPITLWDQLNDLETYQIDETLFDMDASKELHTVEQFFDYIEQCGFSTTEVKAQFIP